MYFFFLQKPWTLVPADSFTPDCIVIYFHFQSASTNVIFSCFSLEIRGEICCSKSGVGNSEPHHRGCAQGKTRSSLDLPSRRNSAGIR